MLKPNDGQINCKGAAMLRRARAYSVDMPYQDLIDILTQIN